jgi:hypothetical protein
LEEKKKRLNQLLDDFKEKRGYWKLKEGAIEHILRRTSFGGGCGPFMGQTEG